MTSIVIVFSPAQTVIEPITRLRLVSITDTVPDWTFDTYRVVSSAFSSGRKGCEPDGDGVGYLRFRDRDRRR